MKQRRYTLKYLLQYMQIDKELLLTKLAENTLTKRERLLKHGALLQTDNYIALLEVAIRQNKKLKKKS